MAPAYRLRSALLVLALVFALPILPLRAQRALAPDAGCALRHGEYLCNWSEFKQAFDHAHTVDVQTERLDRSTVRQLHGLVNELGKADAGSAGAADLTFLLVPVDPTGINLGPGDHDLATLRVYAPAAGSERGVLLWVETLRGQGDRPWPAQAHLLIEQFRRRFHQG